MSGDDKDLSALFEAAVEGQEKLVQEAEQELDSAFDDDEPGTLDEGAADDDEEEIVLPDDEDEVVLPDDEDFAAELAADAAPAAGAPAPAEPAPAPKPAKKSATDAITEALIKAKQEALEALAQTQVEAKSMHDRLLRVSADFENFRKRARKQQEDAVRFANEGLLRELLPVLDNFDRAMEHADDEKDNPVVQGIVMVHQHMGGTLEKIDVKPFSALGEPFDPAFHEAVEQEVTDEHPAGSVVREYQKGYMLHERLLRPAMVVVAKAPEPPAEEAEVAAAGAPADEVSADEPVEVPADAGESVEPEPAGAEQAEAETETEESDENNDS